jgi:hypothetical protein
MYAVTGEGIFKTMDGGLVWTLLPGFPTQYMTGLAVDPVNTNIIYAAAQTYVFQSVDGGVTRRRITPDYEDMWLIYDIVTNPSHPGQVLIATQGAGVKVLTVAPDLQVSYDAPTTQAPNTALTYRVIFTNLSTFDATNVTAEIAMPNVFGNYTLNLGTSSGSCVPAGNRLSCTLPILQAQASWNVSVTTTPTALGTFTINGKIAAEQNDAIQTNNDVPWSVTIVNAPQPSGGGGGSLSLWVLLCLATIILVGREWNGRAPTSSS